MKIELPRTRLALVASDHLPLVADVGSGNEIGNESRIVQSRIRFSMLDSAITDPIAVCYADSTSSASSRPSGIVSTTLGTLRTARCCFAVRASS